MKVDIEQVEATLLERKVEPVKVLEIIKDLTQAVEEDKAENKKQTGPTQKWEFIVVLNDPDGKLAKEEFTGWVVQQKSGQDAGLILSKLSDAAKASNDAAKRKKTLLKSYIDVFEALKPKWAKEKGLRIKTKEAVRVISVNGKTL